MVSPTQSWEERFRRFYTDRGFMNSAGGCLPLHEACVQAKTCWNQVLDSERPPARYAGIYRPWVGRKYSAGGILVFGLNMNEAGGFDAYYDENGVPRYEGAGEAKQDPRGP
jgi:hypothetical protein